MLKIKLVQPLSVLMPKLRQSKYRIFFFFLPEIMGQLEKYIRQNNGIHQHDWNLLLRTATQIITEWNTIWLEFYLWEKEECLSQSANTKTTCMPLHTPESPSSHITPAR